MDCEKFDQHVLDALYDELDELTYAALRRHVEGCSRCASVWAGLRATREVGILPIEEPPDDLEARILDAVDRAEKHVPWHKNVLRVLAWAGSHAMRPQLAMAALFFLVIGSSLLLLRPHGSADRASAVSAVSERGRPEPAGAVALAPAATAPAAAASAAIDARVAAAESPVVAGVTGVDGKPARDGAKGAGGDEARSALAEARALRDRAGCPSAVSRFDAVAVAYPGSQPAADAMWDEASCYRDMGDASKAQQLYLALRSTGYRERAERELDGDLAAGANNAQALASKQAARAAPTAAPSAVALAAPAAPPPAAAATPSDPESKAKADASGGAVAGPYARPKPAAGAVNPRAPAAPAKRAMERKSDLGL